MLGRSGESAGIFFLQLYHGSSDSMLAKIVAGVNTKKIKRELEANSSKQSIFLPRKKIRLDAVRTFLSSSTLGVNVRYCSL